MRIHLPILKSEREQLHDSGFSQNGRAASLDEVIAEIRRLYSAYDGSWDIDFYITRAEHMREKKGLYSLFNRWRNKP